MVRISGCSTNLYIPTYHIGKMIEQDMVDESRWFVSSSTEYNEMYEDWYTTIQVTWHPRACVFRYLKNHLDIYQEKRDHPTAILSIRARRYTRAAAKGTKGGAKFNFSIRGSIFDEGAGTITASDYICLDYIHASRMMKTNTSALPAQRVKITITCPHYDGIIRHMPGGADWKERHPDFYYGGAYFNPYVRKWSMTGYISSRNHVYNREKVNSDYVRCPLSVKSNKHSNYHQVREYTYPTLEEENQE